jgi:uncharacterized cupredoxin-like copper-binding protein
MALERGGDPQLLDSYGDTALVGMVPGATDPYLLRDGVENHLASIRRPAGCGEVVVGQRPGGVKVRGRTLLQAATVAVLSVLVACGNDGTAGDGATVSVTLDEWSVASQPASARAGEVTFEISNVGEETHEFVVIATDLGMLDLPTAADGSAEEGTGDLELVDEVEDVAAGASETLSVDLEPGHYVLICNIVEEEMEMEEMEMEHDPSHFQNGMRAEFTVE